MKINIGLSNKICQDSDIFLFCIGSKKYNFGFQIHEYGVRFMLLFWHVLIWK